MTAKERAGAALAGAAAGFFGGLFGVGGGAVLIPILTSRFRLTQHQAHGTSLAVIVFTAIAAGSVYALHGNVDWITGAGVGFVSLFTAPLGARLAARTSGRGLRRAFALFLVILAARMLWTPPASSAAHAGVGLARLGAIAGIGLAAGLLAGFMGVGGGVVAVPAFSLILGFTQQLAQGTSLLAIVGASLSGSRQHARQGTLVPSLVPWLALGSVVAAPAASWWVQRIPHTLLVRGFAVFLLANAVQTWMRAEPAKT